MKSIGLWIVLAWVSILGSRAVSIWFDAGKEVLAPDDYLEGSPFDRNIWLLLIGGGIAFIIKKKISWKEVLSSNKWIVALFGYYALSIIWSDFPLVSFKRWFKDCGNLIMALILITEMESGITAVFYRFSYIALPLSVTLIKYFPDLGRQYNRWTYENMYTGITTNKNELGIVLAVSGLFLIHGIIHRTSANLNKETSIDLANRLILLGMLVWLLIIVDSSTALVTLILGSGIVLTETLSVGARRLTYAITAGVLLFGFIPSIFGLGEHVYSLIGRDQTLTGRTDLWGDLLNVQINPIIGTGYRSFWLGPRAEYFWDKYAFHPVQAHNGYLESYLNGGLIGILLLLGVICSAGLRLTVKSSDEQHIRTLQLTFLVVVLMYNWTEALFNSSTLIWFIFLICVLNVRMYTPKHSQFVRHGVC